ncbi:hypothetical protein ACRALDRAFT_2015584 [Sodiomyces alcalophilus JCM 7366]|uniref:uncharacterized protein n=1 Tax=Sodiomyces alcalophilus JCM 7366 TaxID=591952 RepID=UPI0039B60316
MSLFLIHNFARCRQNPSTRYPSAIRLCEARARDSSISGLAALADRADSLPAHTLWAIDPAPPTDIFCRTVKKLEEAGGHIDEHRAHSVRQNNSSKRAHRENFAHGLGVSLMQLFLPNLCCAPVPYDDTLQPKFSHWESRTFHLVQAAGQTNKRSSPIQAVVQANVELQTPQPVESPRQPGDMSNSHLQAQYSRSLRPIPNIRPSRVLIRSASCRLPAIASEGQDQRHQIGVTGLPCVSDVQ